MLSLWNTQKHRQFYTGNCTYQPALEIRHYSLFTHSWPHQCNHITQRGNPCVTAIGLCICVSSSRPALVKLLFEFVVLIFIYTGYSESFHCSTSFPTLTFCQSSEYKIVLFCISTITSKFGIFPCSLCWVPQKNEKPEQLAQLKPKSGFQIPFSI